MENHEILIPVEKGNCKGKRKRNISSVHTKQFSHEKFMNVIIVGNLRQPSFVLSTFDLRYPD